MRLREDSRQLSGRVELDEGYLGGQRSGGRAGRGSENKVPFVTAVQTTVSGEAQFVCLAQVPFTKEAVTAFVEKCLVPPLTVVSDGLACFTVTAIFVRLARVASGSPARNRQPIRAAEVGC